MVQVRVCLAAKVGCAHLLVAALLPLMRRAQQSPGCSAAHVLADVNDANVFWYQEDWQDTQALECRVRGEQFDQLLALMETAARPPILEFLTLEGSRGLDYVEAVRQAEGRYE
jgi:quinol monooxygenase YgiN